MMDVWRGGAETPGDGDCGRSSAGAGPRWLGLPRPSFRWLGLALPVVCLSLFFLPVAGCLFDTRTPEPPSDNGVAWKYPRIPDSVLTNVSVTFNAKQVPNYQRSLAEGFTFLPFAGEVPTGDPTRFERWDTQQEVDAFGSAFEQTKDGVVFSWGPPRLDAAEVPGLPDDRYYENLKYKMVFTHTAGNKTFSGMVDLYLREGGGTDGWSIYKWVDKKDPGDASGNPTLTKLRADPSAGN